MSPPPPSAAPAGPDPAHRRAAQRVLRLLGQTYPAALCALHHRNAFELLAATILSAQCTDVRVNQHTPALFAAYPTPARMAEADPEHLERLVQPLGFFRNKARHLKAMATQLVTRHAGEVPAHMVHLVALSGVARKTANVVLGECFATAEGVVVDTHVLRLSARLGLTANTDPVRVERDLMALFARRHWIVLSHRLIAHGRALCQARRPLCSSCPLQQVCPTYRAGN